MKERADITTLQRLMNLVLFKVHHDEVAATDSNNSQRSDLDDATPVYRAG
jgi:hypothetical protein